MWIFDQASGSLHQGGTLIGDGECALAAGDYALGQVTDLTDGIPIVGAGRITATAIDATDSLIVPADVVARIIASKADTLRVVAVAIDE